ncbi:MAG TPA: hypothetical protein VFO75_02160 [Candidatus Dormibacteraeota bacterium]|nr:hypothetical protein [Candidatus Dormibacteraeota bacterium]
MSSPDVDAVFDRVARAFSQDRRVTRGNKDGKGFGSTGLKVDGKLFALVSSRDQFVLKLPKTRVQALVADGAGVLWDPGHGRLMREWIALNGHEERWLDLAREARAFVGKG